MRGTSIRQSVLAAIIIAAFSLTSGLASADPAAAATTRVTIGKIATKTAPYGGKVTVKPNVTKAGQVEVSKTALTVRQGSRTLVSGKSSASLKAGTYRVTQAAWYRTYTVKKTTTTVKKKVVGAPAYLDVKVSCVPTRVVLDDIDVTQAWGMEIDASCTSSAFDGAHTFSGYLMNINADGSLWYGFADENLDELTTSITPVVGKSFDAVLNPEDDLMKTKDVKTTTSKKVYSSLKKKTSTHTLVIKQGKKPTRVNGPGGYNCPKGYPVKGNADSMIYHVPGGAFYSRTIPEDCFATESAARSAGYRKSQR